MSEIAKVPEAAALVGVRVVSTKQAAGKVFYYNEDGRHDPTEMHIGVSIAIGNGKGIVFDFDTSGTDAERYHAFKIVSALQEFVPESAA